MLARGAFIRGAGRSRHARRSHEALPQQRFCFPALTSAGFKNRLTA